MDPNATLARFRDAMAELTRARNAYADSVSGETDAHEHDIRDAAEQAADAAADLDHWLAHEHAIREAAEEAADLAADLDWWIRRGGFLPDDWQR